jgi:MFS family permease
MRLLHPLRGFAADLPRAFWVLWAGTLVNRMGTFVLPFLTLFLTARRGLTPATATLIVGLYGAGAFAATFTGGYLADRLGRRRTILVSLLAGAGALLLVLPARDPLLLATVVVAVGFTGELYRPAVAAAVADLVPPLGRPRAYSLLHWAANLGMSVGPVLGGLLASRSYLALFLVDAATMAAFAGLVAWRVAETRPAGEAGGQGGSAGAGGLARALRDRRLVGVTLLALPVAMLFWQGFTVLPLGMAAKGLGATSFGLALSLNGAIIALFSLPIAVAVARLPRLPLMAAATVLVAVGMAAHGPASSFGAYAAAVVVWTLGEMAWVPVAPSLVADLAPPHLRGSYQGVYSASWGLAALLGPALGGAVFQRFGDTVVWAAGGTLALLAAAGFLALGRLFRPPAEAAEPAPPPA